MIIFTDIHEIIFHGNGGYSYNDVYSMPIWLRKFTYNKLKEYYDSRQKEKEKWMINEENPNIVLDKSQILKNIDNKPNYTVKAPKK
jgi:hypothetical protein